MLDSDRLLSVAERDSLFTPVRADYAYGWWIQTKLNHKVRWHGGNVSGFVSQISRYPDQGLFIAVLSNVWSNADRSQVRALANELSAMAFGESYEPPRAHKETKVDPATYDAYVGQYSNEAQPDGTFALAREGSRLMVQFPPGVTVFEIFPESGGRFFAKGREYYVTVVSDGQGRVTHVLVRHEGEETRWMKSS